LPSACYSKHSWGDPPLSPPITATRHSSITARRNRPLTVLALVLVAAVLSPVVFLLWQASGAGWTVIWRLIWRGLTRTLLVNTIELSVIVTVCSAVTATGAAWLTERTNLPMRGVWRVLVVLPLAIPDFITGYTWSSLSPAIHGLPGAALVMTLGLYPLVYLPVAAALRRADGAVYDVARSLGRGRLRAFCRAMMPQIAPALSGGCLLVLLGILAEYGAFEILRFQTFTTEIFNELDIGFNYAAASALSLVLVLLALAVLAGEVMATSRQNAHQPVLVTVRAGASQRLVKLGRAMIPALAGLAALIAAGVGVPVATVVYWLTRPSDTTLPPIPLDGAAGHTLAYAAAAAVLATAAAFPVALLAARSGGRFARVLERAGYLVQGLPGLVIALALVFFATRLVFPLYESWQLLVICYAIMFFPLALVSLRASLAQIPWRLTEVARSLGCTPLRALLRVTLPLAAPGIGASLAMVFLSAVTELTATLVLVPNGVNTLATAFWAYEAQVSYASAAPYAAVILVFAIVPGLLLTRWRAGGRRSDAPGQ
jgi:iron(III) transport system permease protein